MPYLIVSAVALLGAALLMKGTKEKRSHRDDSMVATTPLYFETPQLDTAASQPRKAIRLDTRPGPQREVSSVPQTLNWSPHQDATQNANQGAAPGGPSRMDLIRSHLQRDEIEDLNSIAQIVHKEKRFLINELNLSETKVQEIQNRRRSLYVSLKGAKKWAHAHGMSPRDFQRSILADHVSWMENQIGVGNYARLQDLTLEP